MTSVPDFKQALDGMVRGRLRRLWSHNIVHNIVALYSIHIVNYMVPLVQVPYLTRVLGPGTWGLVAFAQAFGMYIGLLVEYGFNLSATREVSRCRQAKERVADVIAGVLGAKLFLAALGMCAGLFVQQFIPLFRDHPQFLWAPRSALNTFCRPYVPLPFFRGSGRTYAKSCEYWVVQAFARRTGPMSDNCGGIYITRDLRSADEIGTLVTGIL